VCGVFTHCWHHCLSICNDLPTVLAYPSEGKCVPSAYKLKCTQLRPVSCQRAFCVRVLYSSPNLSTKGICLRLVSETTCNKRATMHMD
jgi:hypothetical protein